MAKAKALVVLVVVAIGVVLSLATYSYLPSNLPLLRELAQWGRPSHGIVDVIDVIPQRVSPYSWPCEWSVNETHVVYRCSGRVEWKLLASTGDEVEELDFLDLRKAGIDAPAMIEYSVTRAADLVTMEAQIVVEAGTDAFGLERFRVEYPTDFFYAWVRVLEPGYWDVDYVGNGTFKAYMTFVTYEDLGDKLRFYPMEVERAREYLRYASLYSRLLEELAGVRLVFEYVEPERACIGLPVEAGKRDAKQALGFICDKYYSGLPLIKVVELPYGFLGTSGFYENRWIYLEGQDSYSIFVHELGHALGLVDVCVAGSGYHELGKCIGLYSPCEADLYYTSLMSYTPPQTSVAMWLGYKTIEVLTTDDWPTPAISLGDFVMLATQAYWFVADLEGVRSPIAMAVLEKLLSIGVNPVNLTVLLPITRDSRIAPGVDELVRQGLVLIDWRNPENSKLNEGLVKALQRVAWVSSVSVETVEIPEEEEEEEVSEPESEEEWPPPPPPPRTTIYVSIGETADTGLVKITVLEVKETEYVKTEWGSIYYTEPVLMPSYESVDRRIVIITLRIEGVRYLSPFSLVYESGWVYLVAVKVERGRVVEERHYFPRYVTTLRRYEWPPRALEEKATPFRDILMTFNRASIAGEDVIEGDVLFTVLEYDVPAKLIIHLADAMIVVNLL